MRANGIIRRIDDLGRVVIPKEIRRSLCIREGDPLEIFLNKVEGQTVVCLCKYKTSFLSTLTALADTINDEMIEDATNEQRRKIRKHFSEIAKILKEWEKRD